MGDNAVAAITIATTIQDIVVVLFQGLSAAAAVILGHEMGGGNLKRAEKYAKYFLILQFLVTLAAMGICFGIRGTVIGMYSCLLYTSESCSVYLCCGVLCFTEKGRNDFKMVKAHLTEKSQTGMM